MNETWDKWESKGKKETYKQEFVKEKKWGVERELLSPKSNSLLKLVFRSSITITSKIYMRMR